MQTYRSTVDSDEIVQCMMFNQCFRVIEGIQQDMEFVPIMSAA